MAAPSRLYGRFCKRGTITRIGNLPWNKKGGEVADEVNSVVVSAAAGNNLEEGRRIIDYKYLATQFQCQRCSGDLSPLHTISETRHGVASTFVVKCQSCDYDNNIYSSTWKTSKSNRRLFDANTKLALGMYRSYAWMTNTDL